MLMTLINIEKPGNTRGQLKVKLGDELAEKSEADHTEGNREEIVTLALEKGPPIFVPSYPNINRLPQDLVCEWTGVKFKSSWLQSLC